MYTEAVDNLSGLKIVNDDIDVQFELIPIVEDDKSDIGYSNLKRNIKQNINQLEENIALNDEWLLKLDKEIDRLTNHADGMDYIIAVASGLIAGIIDSFWVGEFNFDRGKAWGNKSVNDFVMKIAKSKGYNGDRLDGAIKFLEDNYKIPSDNIWKDKGLGISARSHHIDDLSHHPTILGLFFSLLTQFTCKAYFQNSAGVFSVVDIVDKSFIGDNIPDKIFLGTVNWFFHLVSDMSGSNKTAGVGMGIPGPIVSLLKEISLIPGINKTDFPKKVNELFVKHRFDLRSELAVGYELSRQAIPVILNECMVRAFYFIRRLIQELKEKQSFEKIDWKKVAPFKNRTIERMITIAHGTFMSVDVLDAIIRGAIKSKGNMAFFGKEVLLRINFVGVGRFVIALGTDFKMGIDKEKLRNERISILSKQLQLKQAKIYYKEAGMWVSAGETCYEITKTLNTMIHAVEIRNRMWEENIESIKNIGRYREGIELNNKDLLDDMLEELRW
ncbi:hypothetical protein [Caloramator sp. ALD01]|uniref:hypothetical protein n=1 Tax=Caloramator sp. ALD01 TaxID=1031288 RepID=UPI00040195C7|nr:hypothetical protein [Caloramator sp. ALD01]